MATVTSKGNPWTWVLCLLFAFLLYEAVVGKFRASTRVRVVMAEQTVKAIERAQADLYEREGRFGTLDEVQTFEDVPLIQSGVRLNYEYRIELSQDAQRWTLRAKPTSQLMSAFGASTLLVERRRPK